MTLVLISGSTRDAYYQREEIAAAIELARSDTSNHRIVPVYLGNPSTYSQNVPYGLRLKHSIYEERAGGIPGVAQLVSNTLREIKGEIEAHRQQRDIVIDLSHNQREWDGLTYELDRRDLGDRLHTPGSLESAAGLESATVMILALPHHTEFTTAEIDRIQSWVRSGGGILILGYYTSGLHHENNVNNLVGVFNQELREDLVMPPSSNEARCRSQVFGDSTHAIRVAIPDDVSHVLLEGVGELMIQSACSIDARQHPADAVNINADSADVWTPTGKKSSQGYLRIIEHYDRLTTGAYPLCVVTARPYFDGRVVIVGTWKILTLNEGDNRRFVDNALSWLAGD